LPTDEQWRRAYVGEGDREFPWQGEPDPNPNRHANYRQTDLKRTSAVGAFPDGAATSGALDMAGNVWEWCLEKIDFESGEVGSGVIDAEGDRRVLRGGSWGNVPDFLRSALRYRYYAVNRHDGIGFRLVCRPPSSTDH
jgi:formylglycine-generating enzyme required for sulfatase activity